MLFRSFFTRHNDLPGDLVVHLIVSSKGVIIFDSVYSLVVNDPNAQIIKHLIIH